MNIASHRGFEVGVAPRRAAFSRFVIAALAAATDAAAIVLISIATGVLYHKVLYGDVGPIPMFVQTGLVTAWLYVVVNAYRLEYSVLSYLEFKRYPEKIVRSWTITFIGLLVLSFLTKTIDAHSRGWLILFYFTGLPPLMLIHALFVRAVAAGNEVGLIATKRLFLVGSEAAIVDFVRRYKVREIGLEIAGAANLHRPDGTPEGEARFASELRDAVSSARALDLDGVFVVVPWNDRATIDRCVEAFMTVPTSIYLAPERLLDRFESIAIEQIGPVASLHLLRPPLSTPAVLVKRICDVVLASAGLVVLSPLLLLVAILIKLDSPGPVLFLQRRYGFNQNPFRIIKFRTMTTLDDGPVVRQATRNDARITRLGQFLRRWNIDELPQLLNVLSGDMSLVGPRPHAIAHDETWGKSISLYARRHNVKPGITGWAQIHGFRGNIGNDDQLLSRIEYDLYYIDNWSIWLDLRILFGTVFFRKAYQNAF
jgi:Undecaprenyl-phosphate glucose phosphotransferase